MRPPWRRRANDDLADVEALPVVLLEVPDDLAAAAVADLRDPGSSVDGEVVEAAVTAAGSQVQATLGHVYDRRTAVLRRLHSLRRAEVPVHGFRWADEVRGPAPAWLEDAFARWESPRHRDPDRIEPIEVGRRRFGRLAGEPVVADLAGRVADARLAERRRWTIAHAAVLAAFNTHTTAAGDALVAAVPGVLERTGDAHAASSLLDGARGVAELGRFGIATALDEAPLVPLLDHPAWQVHGSATSLLAALPGVRSDAATDVLVRLGHHLAVGSKATEIRAEQVVDALATTDPARRDVDDALDALRSHASSAVRVAATTTLARRRPERARSLWEPWLGSRSFAERTAAESMLAAAGDERDVPEAIRILEHRARPPRGRTHWPPLASESLAFLARHRHVPEAAAALDRIRDRWDRHDDDLRRWLRLHHPDLVPPD